MLFRTSPKLFLRNLRISSYYHFVKNYSQNPFKGSNAYSAGDEFPKAIEDAYAAILKNPAQVDGYIAKALREMGQVMDALKVLSIINPKDETPEVHALREEFDKDIKLDLSIPIGKIITNHINIDCPEFVQMQRFLKWLKDNGAIFDKLQIRFYTKNYRGVHAKSKIKLNEVFLVVPQRLIMTLEMARESPIGAKMMKANLHLISPKHSFLSTLVMQEKRIPESKWHPYLDILPKDLGSFPIFFTPEEKKWLEGSPF